MAWEEFMDVGKVSVREREEEGGRREEEEEKRKTRSGGGRRGVKKNGSWGGLITHTHTHRMFQTTKYNGGLRSRSQVTVQPSSTRLEPLALPRYNVLHGSPVQNVVNSRGLL